MKRFSKRRLAHHNSVVAIKKRENLCEASKTYTNKSLRPDPGLQILSTFVQLACIKNAKQQLRNIARDPALTKLAKAGLSRVACTHT